MYSRFRRTLWLGLVLGSLSPLTAAPSIETALPGLGQRGTTFELRLTGAELDQVLELAFYNSGLVCRELRATSENELTAVIEADPTCPLGTHPFRIRSTTGWSELKIVRISPFPIVEEVEEDGVAPQRITATSTIHGTLPGDDIDRFRITLKHGERCSAEIEGVRLAAGLTDTRLRVLDPTGRLMLVADDGPLFAQDPVVSFRAETDGDYVIEVALSGEGGDDNSRYALHLGTFPRPLQVYPGGGPAGTAVDLRWTGDAAGDWSETITLPATADRWYGLVATRDGQTAPTSMPFRVVPYGNILEPEPEDAPPEEALRAPSLPIAFNGRLSTPGNVDRFAFLASHSDRLLRFESFANRLGSPADLELRIVTADGTVLARNDDHEGLDSGLTWRCTKSDTYYLEVREQRGGGGPDDLYRVEAGFVESSATAFLARRDRLSQSRQTIAVPRGNRVLALMGLRRDADIGSAALTFPELPAGLSIIAPTWEPDQFLTPVVLEAAADAPVQGALLPLGLQSNLSDTGPIQGRFEQTVDLVASSADRLYQGVTVDKLAVAIVEPAPFRVRLAPLETGLPKDGTLDVLVQVERDAEFQGAIDVSFPWLPPWVSGPDKITVPPDQSSGVYHLTADREVALGDWPLVAEAKPGLTVARDDETNAAPGVPSFRQRGSRRAAQAEHIVASPLTTMAIIDTPLAGEIGKLLMETGQTVTITIPLTRRGVVPEQLTAELEGLPNRVTAEPIMVGPTDATITMTVKLAEDAPTGTFDRLTCRLSGQIGGQAISYVIGRGGQLKIVPQGELIADETGRPLSPLELLRRRAAKPVNQP
jgi:hypothetical protein